MLALSSVLGGTAGVHRGPRLATIRAAAAVDRLATGAYDILSSSHSVVRVTPESRPGLSGTMSECLRNRVRVFPERRPGASGIASACFRNTVRVRPENAVLARVGFLLRGPRDQPSGVSGALTGSGHSPAIEARPQPLAPAAPAPSSSPARVPSTVTSWYGYQILVVDAAVLATTVWGSVSEEYGTGYVLAIALFVADGPVVHALHHHPARALVSAALRVGLPVLCMLAGGAIGAASAGPAPRDNSASLPVWFRGSSDGPIPRRSRRHHRGRRLPGLGRGAGADLAARVVGIEAVVLRHSAVLGGSPAGARGHHHGRRRRYLLIPRWPSPLLK
jgi:hypothetical protein